MPKTVEQKLQIRTGTKMNKTNSKLTVTKSNKTVAAQLFGLKMKKLKTVSKTQTFK